MIWIADGIRLDPAPFAGMQPVEVLYQLETPMIYTSLLGSQLVLVYQSAVDLASASVRLIVVPVDQQSLAKLKTGQQTVVGALDQPHVWAVTQDFNGDVTEVCLLNDGIRSVPAEARPVQGALLWPHLMTA
ncbi:hypothetical protein ACLB1G_12580 [Oxalobacteraceae bacterium A2-2]